MIHTDWVYFKNPFQILLFYLISMPFSSHIDNSSNPTKFLPLKMVKMFTKGKDYNVTSIDNLVSNRRNLFGKLFQTCGTVKSIIDCTYHLLITIEANGAEIQVKVCVLI